MEPITTAISIVLSKIVMDKFYEGVSSKLGEKVVEKALVPIEALGKLLWNRCFKGKPGTDELMAKAEKGDAGSIATLKDYLTKALADPQFKAEVEPIVQQIHQTIVQIDDDSTMTQNNYGGTNYQTKTGPNNTNFLGGEHHHH